MGDSTEPLDSRTLTTASELDALTKKLNAKKDQLEQSWLHVRRMMEVKARGDEALRNRIAEVTSKRNQELSGSAFQAKMRDIEDVLKEQEDCLKGEKDELRVLRKTLDDKQAQLDKLISEQMGSVQKAHDERLRAQGALGSSVSLLLSAQQYLAAILISLVAAVMLSRLL